MNKQIKKVLLLSLAFYIPCSSANDYQECPKNGAGIYERQVLDLYMGTLFYVQNNIHKMNREPIAFQWSVLTYDPDTDRYLSEKEAERAGQRGFQERAYAKCEFSKSEKRLTIYGKRIKYEVNGIIYEDEPIISAYGEEQYITYKSKYRNSNLMKLQREQGHNSEDGYRFSISKLDRFVKSYNEYK